MTYTAHIGVPEEMATLPQPLRMQRVTLWRHRFGRFDRFSAGTFR